MHQPRRADYFATELLADGLVSETNTEDWFLACKGLYDIETYAGFGRSAGAGRDKHAIRVQMFRLSGR